VSGLLIIDGGLLVVVGFVMRTLSKVTSHYRRRLVGMTWSQIAEMRSQQNWLERGFYQRAPRPRGGTALMLVGSAMVGMGMLAALAGT
jgi:hypothetical protein